ncbi:MAG: ROK family protein [Anaerolineae bacterium]|nr:ROK family protein [Anaerolineae bacterium]
MKHFIGIDMGGTNIKTGIVDLSAGEVVHASVTPTLGRLGHEAVMGRIADQILETIQEGGFSTADIGGVGVGVPGVLDLDQGLVLFLPNLPGNWRNVALRRTLEAKTGLPAALLNDARAITYGEWKFGAGKGVDTIACFTLGTGIGGGLVIEGRLHLGIGGTGGELGHQCIDPNGPQCGCGGRGCLESLVSGPAIAALGVRAVLQGRTTSLGSLAGADLNNITPELIWHAARQGDPVANEMYELVGEYLGVAVSTILVTVGPRKVILAGGVAGAGDLLLNPIRRRIRLQVFMMPADQVEVVIASLGANAGILGVAAWAAQKLAK